jgi:hypothetical protein
MKVGIKLIVNADDFGASRPVNDGILEGLKTGAISSTTLILSKPGFEDALDKISSDPELWKGRIGLHINLTDGRPLTDPIKKCRRFVDPEGCFCYDRRRPAFFLSAKEKRAIALEVEAQIEACTRHGITPTHIDSHRHVHTEWPIAWIVVAAAKAKGIRRIRISRNIGEGIGLGKRIYKALYNRAVVRGSGMIGSDYFASLEDWVRMTKNGRLRPGVYEIMVHPSGKNDEVVDEDSQLRIETILPLIRPFELIGFGDLG